MQAAAKNIKTQEDFKEFQQMLTKITVEAALHAELDDHLGYIKHEPASTDPTTGSSVPSSLESHRTRRTHGRRYAPLPP
jgi:putative transposase